MPKKHIIVPANAAAVPPLPAHFLEILIALPIFAWVENSKGKILAHNCGLASGPTTNIKSRARGGLSPTLETPGAPCTSNNKSGGLGEASPPATPAFIEAAQRALTGKRGASGASWKTTTYPLPPIAGCPRRLRLVALVSGSSKNDCHARVISALLSLLLGATRPDNLRLTPQQRAIYRELSRGSSHKEAAANLGISHNALRVQLTRMRKRLGDRIIPRIRRSAVAANTVNQVKLSC